MCLKPHNVTDIVPSKKKIKYPKKPSENRNWCKHISVCIWNMTARGLKEKA